MKGPPPDDIACGCADELGALFARSLADESSARELYERCRPIVAARLRRRFSAETAEDTAHEAIAAALGNCAAYNASRPFLPWLHTLAQHIALDVVRSGTSRCARERAYVESESLCRAGRLSGDRRETLMHCLAALPPAKRRLIERRYFRGESGDSIAAAMRRTRVAVAVELHRICRTLRTLIEQAERLALSGAGEDRAA